MARRIAALAVLGAALWLPRTAPAQSAMCVEPAFGAAIERAAAPSEAPSPRDEDLPWCAGADDPRCAPLPGDSTALRLSLRQPLAVAAPVLPGALAIAFDSRLTPHEGLRPHPGSRSRVERPPRPGR